MAGKTNGRNIIIKEILEKKQTAKTVVVGFFGGFFFVVKLIIIEKINVVCARYRPGT